MKRRYKIRWTNGIVEDNVWIHDGAWYTWEEVAEIIKEYCDEKRDES